MEDLLDLETRRKIYALIAKHPGLHMSKIAEMLNMRLSLVQYHVAYLEKKGAISVVRDIGFTKYYVKMKIGTRDKEIIFILRKEVPLRIVLILLKHPNSTHAEILKQIDIVASTLSYHLDKLVKKGIIKFSISPQNEKRYCVFNEEEIVRILARYKPFTLIDGFKDAWIDLKLKL